MKAKLLIIGSLAYMFSAFFISWLAIILIDMDAALIRTKLFWNSFLVVSVFVLSFVPGLVGFLNKKNGVVAGLFLPFIGGLIVLQIARVIFNLSADTKLHIFFSEVPKLGDYSIVLTPITLSWVIGPIFGGVGELLGRLSKSKL